MTEAQPELLAHHCTEAGLAERGGRATGRGRAAGSRSALGEPRRSPTSTRGGAAGLPTSLPERPANPARQVDRGCADRHGCSSPPGGRAAWPTAMRARELCRGAGRSRRRLRAVRGMWTYYVHAGRGQERPGSDRQEQLDAAAEGWRTGRASPAVLDVPAASGRDRDLASRRLEPLRPGSGARTACTYVGDSQRASPEEPIPRRCNPGAAIRSRPWRAGPPGRSPRPQGLDIAQTHGPDLAGSPRWSPSARPRYQRAGRAEAWVAASIALATEHGFPTWWRTDSGRPHG